MGPAAMAWLPWLPQARGGVCAFASASYLSRSCVVTRWQCRVIMHYAVLFRITQLLLSRVFDFIKCVQFNFVGI